MRLRLGQPRAALIVAPHPDDEVIGCFGLIGALRRRGTRVRVLIVTDGAASHPNSARWPRARLVRERRRETLRAMRRLGVDARAVCFLRHPDGGLDRHAPTDRIGRTIAKLCPGGIVAGPCPTDAHPDHRATAHWIAHARLPGVRRLAYGVWPPGARIQRGCALMLGAHRHAKRSTLHGYRTQTGAITDDAGGFRMARHEIAAFCGPREWFREARA